MQIRPHLRRPNCLFDFNAPVSRTCLIQEAMHVYRSDDLSYEKIIKKGILALFKNIRAGNLVQVFKNDKTLYATTDITLNIVTSKTISLYMNVVNYGPLSNNICDAVNISQPTFGYEKDDIVDEQYPLCTENKASIIFTVSPDVPAKNNKTCVLKAAKHELMHIYHDQLKLNTLAGDAMWYCEQILRIHQLSFPNESDIHMLLYKSSLTSLDYVLLLAACMYYTDKSESSAFMETFNVESINIIRRGRIYRYKKHVI